MQQWEDAKQFGWSLKQENLLRKLSKKLQMLFLSRKEMVEIARSEQQAQHYVILIDQGALGPSGLFFPAQLQEGSCSPPL